MTTASVWSQPAAAVYVGGTYSFTDGDTRPGAQSYRALSWDGTGAVALRAIEIDVTTTMEWGSVEPAQARLLLAETDALTWPQPAQRWPLLILLGYIDPTDLSVLVERAFTGWLLASEKTYFPETNTLTGAGMLWLAQLPLKNQVRCHELKHWEWVKKLYQRAGIQGWDLDGLDAELGTMRDLLVQEYTAPADHLGQLTQITQYTMWDSPDGTVKSRRLETDESDLGTTAAYALSEAPAAGEWLILSGASYRFDGSAVRNRQKVLGLVPDDPALERPEHTRHVLSDWVPHETDDDPDYVSETISSDVIQTADLAEDVSKRAMRLRSGPLEHFNCSTPGNPYFEVGKLATVYSPSRGLSTPTNFQIYRVAHRVRAGSFTTELSLRRHFNDEGDHEDTHPVADFDVDTTDNGDGTTTVSCDGLDPSFDPDSDGELTYSWSNNRTSDTVSQAEPEGATYSFVLDTVALDGCEVTLTVTDPDQLRATITKAVD